MSSVGRCNSKRGEIERLISDFGAKSSRRVRYIDWRHKPFNYSVINNEAARQCGSPLLLFLNDDTEVISGDWLTAMVESAWRSEVGCVGAKLLYPDGRIQHAGVEWDFSKTPAMPSRDWRGIASITSICPT